MSNERADVPDTIEALGCMERPENMDNGELVRKVMIGFYAESLLEARMEKMIGDIFKRIFGENVKVLVSRMHFRPGKDIGTVYADSGVSWGTMGFTVQFADGNSEEIIVNCFRREFSGSERGDSMSVWNFVCSVLNRDYPELGAKCSLGNGVEVSIGMLGLVQSAKKGAPHRDVVAATSGQLGTDVDAVLDGDVPGSSRRGPGGW